MSTTNLMTGLTEGAFDSLQIVSNGQLVDILQLINAGGGGREIRRVECVGYSLFVFPTATFLCPWGHSYLAKLTRRVR